MTIALATAEVFLTALSFSKKDKEVHDVLINDLGSEKARCRLWKAPVKGRQGRGN
ncbi:MAG: hypothetical protein ABSA46_16545 [Thermodesulfovibrionales bacterium]|jgi:hypothetical protein